MSEIRKFDKVLIWREEVRNINLYPCGVGNTQPTGTAERKSKVKSQNEYEIGFWVIENGWFIYAVVY
ncbi:MAG: hypothetical protein AN486_05605 [Anabaena sp. AL93]|jgi:hypothetical protein|nr:MAG: hypothetical protein AN486_05605 [Anabaena sp. AL93]